MRELPTGTITFLFTDIEGSTRLLQRLGNGYVEVISDHHRLIRAAVAASSGTEVKTEGDAFFVVFPTAIDGVRAAVTAQKALAAHDWPDGSLVRVRMGLHSGEVSFAGGEYVGLDVHRAARIAAAAHGGQVLLSSTTHDLAAGAVAADAAGAGVAMRDLGEHRLKDLERPEHLYQLTIPGLSSDFPPIHSMSSRFEILPTELTAFIGRESEMAQIEGLLAHTRLLTLTGPGGTGKSRLAAQVARRTIDGYRDGAAFVALAPIRDAALVPSTVMHALGLREVVGRSAVETVVDGIGDRRMLLVLDNFEQVLPAAETVRRLLAGAPGLTILVTSRAPLHVEGEQEAPVPPLRLPEAEELSDLEVLCQSEAVALFMQRARTVRPDFEITAANAGAVVEICRRLDGLPLAIELAASRVRLLPPEALLARLTNRLDLLQSSNTDRSDRQRTLRGAIDWSHDLLDADERATFRRLAIFVGGWDLADAEAIVPAAGRVADVLDGTGALVDHSLVRQDAQAGEPRFGMLETIREYGLEQLAASGELETTARAHAERFLGWAIGAAGAFTGGGDALARAERDHDNLRAALRWAIDHDESELALAASGALWRFWHLHGHLREGGRLTDEALAIPRPSAATVGLARALYGAGSLAYWRNEFDRAGELYDAALVAARSCGDVASEAETLYALGYLRAIRHEYDGAREALRESHRLYEASGDALGVANARFAEAMVESIDGEPARARPVFEELLVTYRALGDRFLTLNTMGQLGRVLQHLGELDRALGLHVDQLDGSLEMGDRLMEEMAIRDIASVAALDGDFERALRLTGASRAMGELVGGAAPRELVDSSDARELAQAAGLDEPTIERLIDEGRQMSGEAALELARRPRASDVSGPAPRGSSAGAGTT